MASKKFFPWASKSERRNAAATHELRKAVTTDFGLATSSEFPEAYVDSSQRSSKSDSKKAPSIASSRHSNDTKSREPIGTASSASNLLAAVSDMLRSPVLLSLQRQSKLDKQLSADRPRPRSYTAPSSPLIAELPGSLLLELENEGLLLAGEDEGTFDDTTMRRIRSNHSSDYAPHRPASSPRELPARHPTHKRSLSESLKAGGKGNPPLPTWSKESDLTTCSQPTNPLTSSYDSIKTKHDSDSPRSLEPAPLIFEKHPYPHNIAELAASDNEALNDKPYPEQIATLRQTITAQLHTISTLSAQFASLRSSHEAHISSLVDAHTKELETLRTYTAGLEQRANTLKTLRQAPSSHLMLMLDTDQPPTTPDRRAKKLATMPSVASLQSFQTAMESNGPSSNSASSTPKKQSPKQQSSIQEEEDIKAELERLKEKFENANSQTVRVLDQLNKTRQKEKAMRNEVKSLEARLEEANSEKVDALEAAQILEDEIRKLHNKHESLTEEFKQFKARPAQSEVDALTTKVKLAEERAAILEIQLEHQNESTRIDAEDAERRLAELAKINDKLLQDAAEGDLQQLKKEIETLKASKLEQAATIAKLQKDSDDYYRLLKSEIRKKACKRQECMADGHLDLELYPRIAKDDSIDDVQRIIQERRAEIQARLSSDDNDAAIEALSDPQRFIEKLQREIEYHVRDVIAFRLDIRGYEKDARRMERRIKKRDTLIQLMQEAVNSPKRMGPTNGSSNPRGSRESARENARENPPSSSGRGISSGSNSPISVNTTLATPQSKLNKPPSPDTEHELETQSSASTLKIHKKLPKPPSSPSTPTSTSGGGPVLKVDPLNPTASNRPRLGSPTSVKAAPSKAVGNRGSNSSIGPAEGATSAAEKAPKPSHKHTPSENFTSWYSDEPHPGTPENRPSPPPPERPGTAHTSLFESPNSSVVTIVHRPGPSLGVRPSTSSSDLRAASIKTSLVTNMVVEDDERLSPLSGPSLVGPRSNSFSTPGAKAPYLTAGKAELVDHKTAARADSTRSRRPSGTKNAPPVANVRKIQAIREAQGKPSNYSPLMHRLASDARNGSRIDDVGKEVV